MAAIPLIPLNEKNINEQFVEEVTDALNTFKNLEGLLTNKEKQQLVALEKLQSQSSEFVKRETAIQEMLDKNLFTPEQAKSARLRNKITLYEYKREKNKFWPKMLQYTKGMAKGITSMAGNWFTKIIGFLIAMAFLDPKGKMLRSILRFFTGILVWFIKVIASYLPELVVTMINLIVNVLPGLLKEIIRTLIPAIGNALRTMGDSFIKKGFPILGQILKWLSKLFSKDGLIYSFLMLIADLSPVLLTGFLILGGIVKLWPLLSAIFTALKVATSFLIANPIVAIIVGVALALILLYKYSDKIIGFFEGIWEWFKKLGIGWKILIGALAAPLLPVIAVIYGLAKFFSAIKKYGLKTTLKMIKNWFVEIAALVFNKVKSVFSRAANFIASPFIAVFKIFKKLAARLDRVFKPLYSVLGRIWDLIKNTILRTITWVKEAFLSIGDIFRAVGHFGAYDFFWKANQLERAAMLSATKLARVKGTTLSEVAKRTTRAGRQVSNILGRQNIRVGEGEISAERVTRQNIRNIERTTRTLYKRIEESRIKRNLK